MQGPFFIVSDLVNPGTRPFLFLRSVWFLSFGSCFLFFVSCYLFLFIF